MGQTPSRSGAPKVGKRTPACAGTVYNRFRAALNPPSVCAEQLPPPRRTTDHKGAVKRPQFAETSTNHLQLVASANKSPQRCSGWKSRLVMNTSSGRNFLDSHSDSDDHCALSGMTKTWTGYF